MVLLPLLAASVAFADSPPVRAYEAELARQCPAHGMAWANPGVIADPIEAFVAALPVAQRRTFADEEDRTCKEVEAGAACSDVAAMRAASRLKLTARLAAQVCASGWRCTAPLTCHEAAR